MILDIGHGVTVEIRELDGAPAGCAYVHRAPDGERHEGWIPFNVGGATKDWDLVTLEPLTISPSLLCRACRHHGFIRGGRWVPA